VIGLGAHCTFVMSRFYEEDERDFDLILKTFSFLMLTWSCSHLSQHEWLKMVQLFSRCI
jgi:hypothetical protein